jgi:hypothetical protein
MGRTMYWEIGEIRRPQHVLHGTGHDGTPYSSPVAIIIRIDPDG